MRIVVISDTHNLHRRVNLPEGDILIHAGDFTISGGGRYDVPIIRDFNEWLGEQPHRHKIVIPGNHDRYFEDYPLPARELITNARFVQDEAFEIEGLKMYGSPWTPKFHSDYWKFHKNRGSEMLRHWQHIPSGLDVLITHGPPQAVLDFAGGYRINGVLHGGEHAGDEMLFKEVIHRAKPKIHVFGHIHPGYGEVTYGGTHFYNAALCGDDYLIHNEPWVIDYEKAEEAGQSATRARDGERATGITEADSTGAAQEAEVVGTD
jgi:Icc-related predicted phosphoesterase